MTSGISWPEQHNSYSRGDALSMFFVTTKSLTRLRDLVGQQIVSEEPMILTQRWRGVPETELPTSEKQFSKIDVFITNVDADQSSVVGHFSGKLVLISRDLMIEKVVEITDGEFSASVSRANSKQASLDF